MSVPPGSASGTEATPTQPSRFRRLFGAKTPSSSSGSSGQSAREDSSSGGSNASSLRSEAKDGRDSSAPLSSATADDGWSSAAIQQALQSAPEIKSLRHALSIAMEDGARPSFGALVDLWAHVSFLLNSEEQSDRLVVLSFMSTIIRRGLCKGSLRQAFFMTLLRHGTNDHQAIIKVLAQLVAGATQTAPFEALLSASLGPLLVHNSSRRQASELATAAVVRGVFGSVEGASLTAILVASLLPRHLHPVSVSGMDGQNPDVHSDGPSGRSSPRQEDSVLGTRADSEIMAAHQETEKANGLGFLPDRLTRNEVILIDAVVRYRSLPSAVIPLVLFRLSLAMDTGYYSKESTTVFRNLLIRPSGNNVLHLLSSMLRYPEEYGRRCDEELAKAAAEGKEQFAPCVAAGVADLRHSELFKLRRMQRGAVFFVSMFSWGSGRVPSLRYPFSALLPAVSAAALSGGAYVRDEVILSFKRLTHRYGSWLQSEWVWVQRTCEEAIKAINPTDGSAPEISKVGSPVRKVDGETRGVLGDVVEVICSAIELNKNQQFNGEIAPWFDMVDALVNEMPASIQLLSLRFRADCTHPSHTKWRENLSRFAQVFLRHAKSHPLRLESLMVIRKFIELFGGIFLADVTRSVSRQLLETALEISDQNSNSQEQQPLTSFGALADGGGAGSTSSTPAPTNSRPSSRMDSRVDIRLEAVSVLTDLAIISYGGEFETNLAHLELIATASGALLGESMVESDNFVQRSLLPVEVKAVEGMLAILTTVMAEANFGRFSLVWQRLEIWLMKGIGPLRLAVLHILKDISVWPRTGTPSLGSRLPAAHLQVSPWHRPAEHMHPMPVKSLYETCIALVSVGGGHERDTFTPLVQLALLELLESGLTRSFLFDGCDSHSLVHGLALALLPAVDGSQPYSDLPSLLAVKSMDQVSSTNPGHPAAVAYRLLVAGCLHQLAEKPPASMGLIDAEDPCFQSMELAAGAIVYGIALFVGCDSGQAAQSIRAVLEPCMDESSCKAVWSCMSKRYQQSIRPAPSVAISALTGFCNLMCAHPDSILPVWEVFLNSVDEYTGKCLVSGRATVPTSSSSQTLPSGRHHSSPKPAAPSSSSSFHLTTIRHMVTVFKWALSVLPVSEMANPIIPRILLRCIDGNKVGGIVATSARNILVQWFLQCQTFLLPSQLFNTCTLPLLSAAHNMEANSHTSSELHATLDLLLASSAGTTRPPHADLCKTKNVIFVGDAIITHHAGRGGLSWFTIRRAAGCFVWAAGPALPGLIPPWMSSATAGVAPSSGLFSTSKRINGTPTNSTNSGSPEVRSGTPGGSKSRPPANPSGAKIDSTLEETTGESAQSSAEPCPEPSELHDSPGISPQPHGHEVNHSTPSPKDEIVEPGAKKESFTLPPPPSLQTAIPKAMHPNPSGTGNRPVAGSDSSDDCHFRMSLGSLSQTSSNDGHGGTPSSSLTGSQRVSDPDPTSRSTSSFLATTGPRSRSPAHSTNRQSAFSEVASSDVSPYLSSLSLRGDVQRQPLESQLSTLPPLDVRGASPDPQGEDIATSAKLPSYDYNMDANEYFPQVTSINSSPTGIGRGSAEAISSRNTAANSRNTASSDGDTVTSLQRVQEEEGDTDPDRVVEDQGGVDDPFDKGVVLTSAKVRKGVDLNPSDALSPQVRDHLSASSSLSWVRPIATGGFARDSSEAITGSLPSDRRQDLPWWRKRAVSAMLSRHRYTTALEGEGSGRKRRVSDTGSDCRYVNSRSNGGNDHDVLPSVGTTPKSLRDRSLSWSGGLVGVSNHLSLESFKEVLLLSENNLGDHVPDSHPNLQHPPSSPKDLARQESGKSNSRNKETPLSEPATQHSGQKGSNDIDGDILHAQEQTHAPKVPTETSVEGEDGVSSVSAGGGPSSSVSAAGPASTIYDADTVSNTTDIRTDAEVRTIVTDDGSRGAERSGALTNSPARDDTSKGGRGSNASMSLEAFAARKRSLSTGSHGGTSVMPNLTVPPALEACAHNPLLALNHLAPPVASNQAPPFVAPATDSLARSLRVLDRTSPLDQHRCGVWYFGPNQDSEVEALSNTSGPPRYFSFLRQLGDLVPISTASHQDKFLGGLLGLELPGISQPKWTLIASTPVSETVYYCATLLPSGSEDCPAPEATAITMHKQRLLGNCMVTVVYSENGLVPCQALRGDFHWIVFVVQPLPRARHKVQIIHRDDRQLPRLLPFESEQVVPDAALGRFMRDAVTLADLSCTLVQSGETQFQSQRSNRWSQISQMRWRAKQQNALDASVSNGMDEVTDSALRAARRYSDMLQ